MRTGIYVSCDSSQVLRNHASGFNIPIQLFPEVENGFPLTPQEVLRKCLTLKGEIIFTTSEHIVLWFMKEVRDGRMSHQDLLIGFFYEGYLYGMPVDKNGDFVDCVPGGFFTERLALLR